jgi:peroxiredoxin
MGKIKPGQSLPSLSGDTLSGKVISTEDYKGRPFILSFYRYAACPFCNLRMHHFIEKYKTEYQPAGIDAIAVFQSPVKSMKKYVSQHDAPFEIVSDPKYKWYKTMGVKTSWLGFALGAANIKQATEATQEGLMRINPEGPVNRLPADFLVGADGTVQKLYYGTNISDHIPFEEITRWIKENQTVKA